MNTNLARAATRAAVMATGLRKSFGDHVVLDGIDLDIAGGPAPVPADARRLPSPTAQPA